MESVTQQLHTPRAVRLDRIADETPSIRSFWFSDSTLHNANPGQFAMVWVPGVDEVPMSVLAIHGRSEAGVVIKKGGPVSTALVAIAMGAVTGCVGGIIRDRSVRYLPFSSVMRFT